MLLAGMLLSGAILVVGGLSAGVLARRHAQRAVVLAVGANVLAAGLGLLVALLTLLTGASQMTVLPWSVPMGTLALRLDPLAAFFAVPTLLVSGLAALYGRGYLAGKGPSSWLWFNLMVASLLGVLLSADGLLFLLCWEAMSVTSFLLVILEDERAEVRHAGLVYLVATHLGTAFLMVLFLVVSPGEDSLAFPRAGTLPPTLAGLAFALGLVGFGTKAGFVPAHVWLPEAHPAAPSHVSAFLSGVILKSGVYGLLRVVTWAEQPSDWWGWLLVLTGLVSGILGVVFALAQHDLKRLLACHSVENLGIIALGLGLGLLGLSGGSPLAAALGLGGGLLHVWNHAWFKSLLFMGAGALGQATGSLQIESAGGLLRRMPGTGGAFLVGSAAISGLPPFNGFVSEFLVFMAALELLRSVHPLAGVAGLGGLALISGLAVACFAKVCGVVFLGEPRSPGAEKATETRQAMLVPMLLLAALCLLIGVAAPLVIGVLDAPLGQLAAGAHLAPVRGSLGWLAALGGLVLLAGLALGHALSRRPSQPGMTWDCGYSRPTARMQYTAASFAGPLTEMFSFVLPVRRHGKPVEGLFPAAAEHHGEVPDPFNQRLYEPLFRGLMRFSLRVRAFQHGEVQLYLLYIVVALIALFIWEAL
jgi:formate hydrogenlyase subunit 3/multisubunit Na+/H+ antiporter MnhD subunit